MAKGRLTKEELMHKRLQLQEEIQKLKNFIASSDTSTFEIMIEDIKSQMHDNVAEEQWNILKANQSRINEIRNVAKLIQNQNELLEQKEDELEDVDWELSHYQLDIFQDTPVTTGIEINEHELMVGDIFEADNGEEYYAVIKHSSELENKFACMTNIGTEESLINYPNTKKMLENMLFVGNIYDEKDPNIDKALRLLSAIATNHEEVQEQNVSEEQGEGE